MQLFSGPRLVFVLMVAGYRHQVVMRQSLEEKMELLQTGHHCLLL
jgi:hypothetical protein